MKRMKLNMTQNIFNPNIRFIGTFKLELNRVPVSIQLESAKFKR